MPGGEIRGIGDIGSRDGTYAVEQVRFLHPPQRKDKAGLTGDFGYSLAFRSLKNARKMSKYLLSLPEIPAGQDFARDSFWWTYRERFTIPMKFRWKVKRTAFKWFDREENAARLEGKPFPPKPIFRKAPPKMPQPNTGKDGANGWTPRNS